jgi:hypothetical protein
MHLIATGNMSFHANSLLTIFSRGLRLLDAHIASLHKLILEDFKMIFRLLVISLTSSAAICQYKPALVTSNSDYSIVSTYPGSKTDCSGQPEQYVASRGSTCPTGKSCLAGGGKYLLTECNKADISSFKETVYATYMYPTENCQGDPDTVSAFTLDRCTTSSGGKYRKYTCVDNKVTTSDCKDSACTDCTKNVVQLRPINESCITNSFNKKSLASFCVNPSSGANGNGNQNNNQQNAGHSVVSHGFSLVSTFFTIAAVLTGF